VPVQPGLSATVDHVVTTDDTAESLGSGDVPMLGTPRVVALAEQASCQALIGALADGVTTVGMRVELTHLAPVPVGRSVQATATLEKVDGRRLVFTVHVDNERGLVAAGKVTRVVVRRDDFLQGAAE
jgi:fluoroacetyl-CoA thioesterase